MKSIAVLFVAVGLASAFEKLDARQSNVSVVSPGEAAAQEGSVQLNSNGLDCNINGLDLSGLNGLNLGSNVNNIDALLGSSSLDQILASSELSQVDLLGGIQSLLGGMGLEGLLQEQVLQQQLGQLQQLEMFLMLEQLMELMSFNFINQVQALELLSSSFSIGGNNLFSFGAFKRGVEVLKTVRYLPAHNPFGKEKKKRKKAINSVC
jgi:hypothetical protein